MESINSISHCGSNAQMLQAAQGSANAENSENVSSAAAAEVQNQANYEAAAHAGAVEGAEAPPASPDINPVESTSISAEAQQAISGDKGLGSSAQNNVVQLLAGMQQQQ